MKPKALAELIPVEKFKDKDVLDFGKCKVCSKPYQIYHVDGVCFDCDIEDRIKNDRAFRRAVNARLKY
jgi:hypothetical protein